MRTESKQRNDVNNPLFLLAIAALTAAGMSYLLLKRAPIYLTLPILLASVLVTWPFSLKSPIGRRWWGASAGFVLGLSVASLLGPGSAIAWVLLNLSVACWTYAVYLRWNPPAGLDEQGRPNPE